eukprot:TRINITY_DN7553_c0_g1_i1.p1 TRINITY_DN7553_c0_g1~~TRINITY_DN7553_c0_g1_i1.p1  ORF type:complete len:420 (-),score=66.47 TRINITY_DN7553_c0_g1_i1:70-1329(-)
MPKPTRHTEYYERLGLTPEASVDDVKKAYRRLAVKFHPDKNPDPQAQDKFKEISAAYEVLSDPEKKSTYDRYGEEGLQGGGFHASSAQSIFEQFFNMGGDPFGRGGKGRGKQKGEDITFNLGVTLRDLYNGKTSKLRVSRNAVCPQCSGKGSMKEGASQNCSTCKGQGVRIITQQIGPMIQQMQTVCNDCKGKGSVIKEKDRCPHCGGNKVIPEEKQIEVHIDRGMQQGQRVTFYGEGEQEPGVEPGDIIVILKEKRDDKNPDVFKRKDNDLIYQHKITLLEALTGFKFYIKHLDDRNLLVTSEPGSIIKPGDIKVVEGEGMPIHKQSYKGNLLIQFDVEFPKPEQIDEPKRAKLKEVLPKPAALKVPTSGEVDEVMTTDYQPSAGRRGQRRPDEMETDEDEDDGRPGRTQAQCMHCIM